MFSDKKIVLKKKIIKVVDGFLHALTIHVAMLLHVKDIYQVVNSVPLRSSGREWVKDLTSLFLHVIYNAKGA